MEGEGRWGFLTPFRAPVAAVRPWTAVLPLLDAGVAYAATAAREVQHALARWDERLAELDGDPLRQDWARFRPLRLSREEDWADWLAHVLETSPGGHFAERLLRRPATGQVSVEREVRAAGVADGQDRRLDVVIRWGAAVFTHLELKVGDQSFAKTGETAQNIEAAQPGTWQHVLLVPPADEASARSMMEAARGPAIEVMTWQGVASALRTCLWHRCGPVTWRVLARVLLGGIEQRLLTLGPVPLGAARIAHAPALLNLLERSHVDHDHG